MRGRVMRRGPFDVGALIAGLAIVAVGGVLLGHFLDVYTLDFGTTWPIMLAACGAILLALGLTSPR